MGLKEFICQNAGTCLFLHKQEKGKYVREKFNLH